MTKEETIIEIRQKLKSMFNDGITPQEASMELIKANYFMSDMIDACREELINKELIP